MLIFSRDADNNYVITQTMHSAVQTKTMTVTWKPDLSAMWVNDETPRTPLQAATDWFTKHQLPKFAEVA